MPKGVYSIPGRRKAWTPDEDMRLADMVEQGLSDAQIAKRLGRSVHSVHVRAARTVDKGAHRPYSAKQVADLLGFGCAKKVSWLIRIGALQGKRSDIRAARHRRYVITEDAVLEFLQDRDHWHLWEPERVTDPDIRQWASELRTERYLTLTEVAERYSVEPGTVAKWIDRGQLRAARSGRGNRVVPESALVGWVMPSHRSKAGVKPRRFTAAEDARLLSMRAAGASWSSISRALGRNPGSMANRFARLQARQQAREAAA